VIRITVHPNFNAGNMKNNVAILRLAQNVPLGQVIDEKIIFLNFESNSL
jgi:hypothetical protein